MKFALCIPFTNIVLTTVDYLIAYGQEVQEVSYAGAFNEGVRRFVNSSPEKQIAAIAKIKSEEGR